VRGPVASRCCVADQGGCAWSSGFKVLRIRRELATIHYALCPMCLCAHVNVRAFGCACAGAKACFCSTSSAHTLPFNCSHQALRGEGEASAAATAAAAAAGVHTSVAYAGCLDAYVMAHMYVLV